MAQWRGVVKKRPWANGDVMSGAPNKIRSLESAERGKEIRFSIVLQLLSTTNVMKTIKGRIHLQRWVPLKGFLKCVLSESAKEHSSVERGDIWKYYSWVLLSWVTSLVPTNHVVTYSSLSFVYHSHSPWMALTSKLPAEKDNTTQRPGISSKCCVVLWALLLILTLIGSWFLVRSNILSFHAENFYKISYDILLQLMKSNLGIS